MGTHADCSDTQYVLSIREADETILHHDGSEAIEAAIEIARLRTVRRKVLIVDSGKASGSFGDGDGTPIHTQSISEFCMALAASEQRIAAIVVIPDERDLKLKSFLREVRELASAEGALLIVDETASWANPKGAAPCDLYGVHPDITCSKRKR